jgi:hypothetical protein
MWQVVGQLRTWFFDVSTLHGCLHFVRMQLSHMRAGTTNCNLTHSVISSEKDSHSGKKGWKELTIHFSQALPISADAEKPLGVF